MAELAEVLDDVPRRAGVLTRCSRRAAEGRGMTLSLADPGCLQGRRAVRRAARRKADSEVELGRRL